MSHSVSFSARFSCMVYLNTVEALVSGQPREGGGGVGRSPRPLEKSGGGGSLQKNFLFGLKIRGGDCFV